VEAIGVGSFAGCRSLTELELPANGRLREIGEDAFQETSVSRLTIPPTVEKLEKGCFGRCWFLSRLELGGGSVLRQIEDEAFVKTRIENFTVPVWVEVIGVDALPRGCVVSFADGAQVREIRFSELGTEDSDDDFSD
jgi:hypothetical protein